eukprot:CAMPEP_0203665474 /NCGR_PEP_ID=MMETSP0090-20130426/2681_1 /ASSEMBLY_ACC=CAM_ASM_001088 /TAXON_ID=426623 /ORGANISM="Chaetoceros affinis, Strain CCMP159" /LENGTH=366 /DNA_ID=CAMNT_0050529039 /DNA_START=356 /DNA_END=1456 /DNA_ORIENTATION=+
MTSLALVFLGHGLADEAHDLITPLSWSEDTYFGGPTLVSKADKEVVTLSSFCHALVHRREGWAHGEFGYIGWQNANYWSSATNSRGTYTLPLSEVRQKVLAIGEEIGGEAKQWCEDHIISEGGSDKSYWESRALHELCAKTSRDEHKHDDSELRLFAQRAAEAELKTLLKYSLYRAGYDCDHIIGKDKDETLKVLRKIDESVALAIANKISSAHIGAFASSDCVTVRNLVRDGADDSFLLSVAVGLACRLLGSPACVYQEDISLLNAATEGIFIILPENETEFSEGASSFYGGGPVSRRDAFAIRIGKNGSEKVVKGLDKQVYAFIPCAADHKKALFVDKFYGSRGERPTSVIQWSKGTIFETEKS